MRNARNAMIHPKHWITNVGVLIANPLTLLLLVVYAILWVYLDPTSFGWNSIATLVTLAMTLFIQRAGHRDTQAIHAKLDELLRVDAKASDELMALDDKEPEDIERHRDQARIRSVRESARPTSA